MGTLLAKKNGETLVRFDLNSIINDEKQKIMTSKTFLIFGISKGLGKAITLLLPAVEDRVYGVSRTEPGYLLEKPNVQWIKADLGQPKEATETIKSCIKDTPIDCLIYNVGIWENNAFSEDYNFMENSTSEITNLINTNVTACILSIQSVIENLKLSNNAKIILIGSTWGLENHKGKEVTFSATKFALRGIVHALRENLREHKIGVSIVNLGYLASEYDGYEKTESVIEETEGNLIPLQDVVGALRFIISTSNASCVKEINMPAMNDMNV